jgi:hypothetical protein
VIYGNLLVILIAASWGIAALGSLDRYDTSSVIYLGVVQLGLSYVLFTHAMASGVRSLDAGIIAYIEPVLNPVWVFLGIGEKPSRWAFARRIDHYPCSDRAYAIGREEQKKQRFVAGIGPRLTNQIDFSTVR